jgi:hypothetical protein
MNPESFFDEVESTTLIIGSMFFAALAIVCLKTGYDVFRTHPAEYKRQQDEAKRDAQFSSWLRGRN